MGGPVGPGPRQVVRSAAVGSLRLPKRRASRSCSRPAQAGRADPTDTNARIQLRMNGVWRGLVAGCVALVVFAGSAPAFQLGPLGGGSEQTTESDPSSSDPPSDPHAAPTATAEGVTPILSEDTDQATLDMLLSEAMSFIKGAHSHPCALPRFRLARRRVLCEIAACAEWAGFLAGATGALELIALLAYETLQRCQWAAHTLALSLEYWLQRARTV